MKDNRAFVVEGYDAMVLCAEVYAPSRIHHDVSNLRWDTITWDSATEEQRNNPNIPWVTMGLGEKATKHAFIPLTEEKKQKQKENKKFQLEQMFKYIRDNYGMEYAMMFTTDRRYIKEIEELKPEFEINEYCKYDGQCNLLCPYFKDGECNLD